MKFTVIKPIDFDGPREPGDIIEAAYASMMRAVEGGYVKPVVTPAKAKPKSSGKRSSS